VASSRRRLIIKLALGMVVLVLVFLFPFARVTVNSKHNWMFIGIGREFLEISVLSYSNPPPITTGGGTVYNRIQYSNLNETPDCEHSHSTKMSLYTIEFGLWHCDSPVLNLPPLPHP
jgi:hypothetical protein